MINGEIKKVSSIPLPKYAFQLNRKTILARCPLSKSHLSIKVNQSFNLLQVYNETAFTQPPSPHWELTKHHMKGFLDYVH